VRLSGAAHESKYTALPVGFPSAFAVCTFSIFKLPISYFLPFLVQHKDSLLQPGGYAHCVRQWTKGEPGRQHINPCFLDIRLERKSETEVEVHLTNLGFPVADSTYVLAVWMVQTEAIGGPLSSYQYHQNVAREALTDINGLEITLPAAGQSSSHTFELRDVVLINDGEIAALAFVQEKNSKHVLNSAFLSLEESSSIRNVTTIELGISPNPASDWIQILRTPVQGARMRILDMQGRLCLETMHTGDPVNISQLPAGTYTVLLEEGLSSGQSTLIITR
jgi:hypothetical protein